MQTAQDQRNGRLYGVAFISSGETTPITLFCAIFQKFVNFILGRTRIHTATAIVEFFHLDH